MFDEIIRKIQAKEYGEAKDALLPLTTKGEPKDIAYANHLLGYIYTCYAIRECIISRISDLGNSIIENWNP